MAQNEDLMKGDPHQFAGEMKKLINNKDMRWVPIEFLVHFWIYIRLPFIVHNNAFLIHWINLHIVFEVLQVNVNSKLVHLQ